MKKLMVLLMCIGIFALPLMAQAQGTNLAFPTGTVIAQTGPASNAAAPILAVALLVILAAIYIGKKGISWKVRKLTAQNDRFLQQAPIIDTLELIQTILNILFPAVTAVLLVLHLNGVIPYITTTEEISGIVLSAAIAIVEIIDAFLKKKASP